MINSPSVSYSSIQASSQRRSQGSRQESQDSISSASDETDADQQSTRSTGNQQFCNLAAFFDLLRTKALSFVSENRSRRVPSTSGVWLVFVLFFCIGFAESAVSTTFFFLLNSHHGLDPAYAVATFLLVRCISYIFYPFMGLLADTYFGHYKVVLTSVTIGLVFSALFSLVFAFLDPLFEAVYWYNPDRVWSLDRMLVLLLFYLLLWMALTGIRVNLIPFGADQLPGASSRELSSYFHFYYWFSCIGSLTAALVVPIIYDKSFLSYAFLLITFSFTGMFFILVLLKEKLIITPNIGNPLKMIYRVLKFAVHARRPVRRSAFQVGQPLPSRIELAMDIHGGVFAVETVENVKTFLQILFILISFIGYYGIYSQLHSTYTLQGLRMRFPGYLYSNDCQRYMGHFSDADRSVECRFLKLPPSFFFSVADLLPLIVIIPLINNVIYPCFGGYMPTMLSRIGVGKVFLFSSICVATGIEWYRLSELVSHLRNTHNLLFINAVPFHTGSSTSFSVSSPVSVFLILPQFVLFAFAEVLSNITAIEFIYAQSPVQMKGLLLGLLFGTESLAMGLAAIIILCYGITPEFKFCSFFGNTRYPHRIAANSSDHMCYDRLHESITDACTDSAFCVYLFFLFVTLIFILVFAFSSIRYKLRRRDPDPYLPWWG